MSANSIVSTIEYTRPPLYDYQRAILDSKARYTVTEASTKVGKTASHIIWIFEQALALKENQSAWWVAPSIGQARIAFDRLKTQIDNKALFKANETNRTITLVNGGKIEFKTAEKVDALFGEDVYCAVFDEFTRAREAAWFALRSTVTSTGGKVKFIGNVKGKKNWGHKLAMKAKSCVDPDFEYHKITAYDAAAAGMMTKDGRPFIEEIEAAKRDLPDNVFKELYLAEATEDGSNPFGLKFIEHCCVPYLSSQPSICQGIDVANKVDFCSIIGLDKLGCMSSHQSFNKVGWTQTINTIKYLPDIPTAIDSTGVGDVVLSQVKESLSEVEGYIFTPSSKQRLIEGLAIGIQQRKITIADDGDVVNGTGKVRHQLEQFEIEYTRTGVKYSAPEGEHDDEVCSLALAWHKYQTASIQSNGPSVW